MMIFPLLSSLSAFALTVLFLPMFIHYQRDHDEGQQIRGEGPKWHMKKTGTPIMGGLVFLSAIILVVLMGALLTHSLGTQVWLFVLVIVLYGAIGFADDGIKLLKKRNMGLTAWQKLLAQILTAIIFVVIYLNDRPEQGLVFPGIGVSHSVIVFALFVGVWLVGFSNAVNLTDGLDGLVGGLGVIAYFTYGLIAFHEHQMSLGVICYAVAGALVGFLLFNHLPAQIFMGDVGSLALGGGLAVISILLQRPWSLLLIGLVFVLETASVILQVGSFKLRGKRIFKMTPIHHHFEMSGWSERKVVLVFWAVGLVSAAAYLLIFVF